MDINPNVDYIMKTRHSDMYFKEYIGSLVLAMAAKCLSDEEIKGCFDRIDSLNDESHPYFSSLVEVRTELRELYENNIKKYRERSDAC